MKDYLESEVSGKQWRRCHTIMVSNPLAPSTPSIMFHESDVIDINGVVTQIGDASCLDSFNPEAVIEVLDPDTLEPTGQTITEGAVYLMLFSKYIATAKKRDIKIAEMTSTPQPPGE